MQKEPNTHGSEVKKIHLGLDSRNKLSTNAKNVDHQQKKIHATTRGSRRQPKRN